jgi:hypothetical protein
MPPGPNVKKTFYDCNFSMLVISNTVSQWSAFLAKSKFCGLGQPRVEHFNEVHLGRLRQTFHLAAKAWNGQAL